MWIDCGLMRVEAGGMGVGVVCGENKSLYSKVCEPCEVCVMRDVIVVTGLVATVSQCGSAWV